jgi:tetratricopeptide (TPR) repeat protein
MFIGTGGRLIQSTHEPQQLSNLWWTLGQLLRGSGDPERALEAANAKLATDRARGDEREAALAQGLIADVLQARGDLDEALRIRREEQLPVYEKLGDVYARAVTEWQIARELWDRDERAEAESLFRRAYAALASMRLPEARDLAEHMRRRGIDPTAG